MINWFVHAKHQLPLIKYVFLYQKHINKPFTTTHLPSGYKFMYWCMYMEMCSSSSQPLAPYQRLNSVRLKEMMQKRMHDDDDDVCNWFCVRVIWNNERKKKKKYIDDFKLIHVYQCSAWPKAQSISFQFSFSLSLCLSLNK